MAYNSILKYPINGKPGWDLEPIQKDLFQQFEPLDDIRDIYGGGMVNGIPEPIFMHDMFDFG